MEDDTKAAFEAVRNGDLLGVMTSVKASSDANVVDDDGSSLLAKTIVKRNTAIMLLLLQRGADPNGRTESESSPHLHFAIATGTPGSGGIDVVELLIQHGADLRGEDAAGNSVLHIAAQAGPMSLYSAYMTRYLIGAGADAHSVNHRGQTPLHIAVTTTARETVRILCQQGARIDRPDQEGKSPLQLATDCWSDDVEHGHLVADYTKILTELGTRTDSQL